MTPTNPVAEFAAMLQLLGKFSAHSPADRTVGDDLAMLTTERVVVGLRSPWARRVALPAWQCYKVLASDEGSRHDRGMRALEVLRQCKDEALKARLGTWIVANYTMPAAQAVSDAPRTGELPLEG